MAEKRSVFGNVQAQRRTAAVFLLVLVLLASFIFVQSRPVALPDEVLSALRSHVGEERWESTTLSSSRSGQKYIIELTEDMSDGRQFVYGYEVGPDLVVHATGMTAGSSGQNPLLLLLSLFAAACLLGYAVYHFAGKVFSKKCPACGAVLKWDELTLFGGAIAKGGESLAPIILTHTSCDECGYSKKSVDSLKGHRAGNINVATLVRPSQEAKLDKIHHDFLDSRTMTHEEWEKLLEKFREDYEEETPR